MPLTAPSDHVLAIHHELVAVCRARRQAEHRLAVLLLEVHTGRLHEQLGHASVLDYAEHALQLGRRQARALLHIGRMLPSLPRVDRIFAEGHLGWTKVREVVRVAAQDTEEAWVARAAEVSSRELKALVADCLPGDPPPTHVGHAGSERTRLVFETASADVELIRDALCWMRADTGRSADEVDDGALLAMMAQRVGERVDMRPGPTRGHLTHTVPPATRRAVLLRDQHRCCVPGCNNRAWVDVHHVVPRSLGGGHNERNLATLCSAHHRVLHDGYLAFWRDRDEWVVQAAGGGERRGPVGGVFGS